MLNIESNENARLVGKIPYDLLDRFRQSAHECRNRQNLITSRELRSLRQIDDLDTILTSEMGLTDALKIG